MPTEIEVKIKVAGHETVRAKLQELGAKLTGAQLETNTFFDTADQALLAADKGLRIRINRPIPHGDEEAIITFKGPRQKGPFKSREETELTIDDPKTGASLFNALGFNTVLSFEKRRESWKLEDCKVELDDLPYLGTYVEVEGPSDAAVESVRTKLGLAAAGQIKTSYIEMLMNYLKEKGIGDRVVRFGKASG